jgi:hypothetical protein
LSARLLDPIHKLFCNLGYGCEITVPASGHEIALDSYSERAGFDPISDMVSDHCSLQGTALFPPTCARRFGLRGGRRRLFYGTHPLTAQPPSTVTICPVMGSDLSEARFAEFCCQGTAFLRVDPNDKHGIFRLPISALWQPQSLTAGNQEYFLHCALFKQVFEG